MIAAHADWSTDPRKRWVSIARRDARGWRAEAPAPVGDPATLVASLLAEGVPVALGLDLPLGVPRGFAEGRAEPGFVPFLRGFTLFFWAAASWWIPFLIALTLWRYLVRRDPLRYEPKFWGMVFPLGMYTTGTLQLARALDLPFLAPIPEAFIHVALAAWFATFAGLVIRLRRAISAVRSDGSAAALDDARDESSRHP